MRRRSATAAEDTERERTRAEATRRALVCEPMWRAVLNTRREGEAACGAVNRVWAAPMSREESGRARLGAGSRAAGERQGPDDGTCKHSAEHDEQITARTYLRSKSSLAGGRGDNCD
eukprot:4333694-Pleurochrysis_carterae.AAC.1